MEKSSQAILKLLASIDTLPSRSNRNHPNHKKALSSLHKAILLGDNNRLLKEKFSAEMMKLDILLEAGLFKEMEIMLEQAKDSLRAEVARYISRYYNDNVHVPKQRDKAIDYAMLSLRESVKLKDVQRQINANNQLGYILWLYEDLEEAAPYFLQAATLHKTGNYEYLEETYHMLVAVTSNPAKAQEYAYDLVAQSVQKKDVQRQINAYNYVANILLRKEEYVEAEKLLRESMRLVKSGNYQYKGWVYQYSVHCAMWQGQYHKGIRYCLEALQFFPKEDDPFRNNFQILLGICYYELNDLSKGLSYMLAAKKVALQSGNEWLIYWWTSITSVTLLKLHRPLDAKALWDEVVALAPPTSNESAFRIHLELGRIHYNLGAYEAAESSYASALRNANPLTDSFDINQTAAELYFATGKYALAKNAINSVLNSKILIAGQAQARYWAFRIDSALGNYKSAILHLSESKMLTDSMNAVERRNELEEFTIQRETEQYRQATLLKDNEIAILEAQRQLQNQEFTTNRLNFLLEAKQKENDLLLLRTQANEKDKGLLQQRRNIDQLHNANLKQQSHLAQANSIKNLTLVFVIILSLLVILLYKHYRSKQKANAIIASKNASLERLVQEKQWLLKEMHHRVKNNMQTIISLLESQSIYLNDEALDANQNSKNRVYAMSLVHQKLYLTDNTALVPVEVYLNDLVNYLRESLVTSNIHFHVSLCSLRLDVAQAISIGLILNEALTNTIKYAFPPHWIDPAVSISMTKVSNEVVYLCIEDNGVGFKQQPLPARPSSLGLTLMHGLAEDLMGSLHIQSGNGTKIDLTFTPKDSVQPFTGVAGMPNIDQHG